ncbi:CAP domain-containing protein [Paucibacter sp. AS339]|uniref:CAP domain-containing protein n=1 Tax=Paucibacter hankyongi TaxID=3133434 RepID=UPI0030B684CF
MVFRSFSSCLLLSLLMAGCAAQESAAPQALQTSQVAQDCDVPLSPQRVLQVLNAFRAQARSCGGPVLAAGAPLRWDARLAASARGHAADLSGGDQLRHLGASGAGVRERLRLNGYLAQRAGENLAAGQESLDEVLSTWVSSSKHCDNIMQAEYSDVGMACVIGPGRFQRYWVLNLGRAAEEQWVPPR